MPTREPHYQYLTGESLRRHQAYILAARRKYKRALERNARMRWLR